MYFVLLWQCRDMIRDPQAMAFETKRGSPTVGHLSFLIESYKTEKWYFEVVECGRRLLLASVIGILSGDTATAPTLGVVLSLLFISMFERKPYNDDDDSILGTTCSYSLTLIFLSALLIKVDVTKDEGQEQQIFGVLLIVILFAGPGLIIAQVVRSIIAEKLSTKVPEEATLKQVDYFSETKDADDVDNLEVLQRLKSKKSIVFESNNDLDDELYMEKKEAARQLSTANNELDDKLYTEKKKAAHQPSNANNELDDELSSEKKKAARQPSTVSAPKAEEKKKVFAFGRSVNADEVITTKEAKGRKAAQAKHNSHSTYNEFEADLALAHVPLRGASRSRAHGGSVGSNI